MSFERLGEAPTKGRMVNISSGGASVEVPCSEGLTLEVGDRTTIRFALTQGANPVWLSAEIQRCESNGKEVTFALQFERPFDRDAEEQVDRYVLERLAGEA